MYDIKDGGMRKPFRSMATPRPKLTPKDHAAMTYLDGARAVYSMDEAAGSGRAGPFARAAERLAWLAENGKAIVASAVASATVATALMATPQFAIGEHVSAPSVREHVEWKLLPENQDTYQLLTSSPAVRRAIGISDAELRSDRLYAIAGKKAIDFMQTHPDGQASQFLAGQVDLILAAADRGQEQANAAAPMARSVSVKPRSIEPGEA
ncbi:hypothetical protein [Vogesella sp. XCS3]|uniref:hypothetical protein n=1 Tax=Vogesella sp. XCS3 TaxID=2877939 RepID=UPI001D0A018D|nr:hypothetical protein [Vogesella sp. XCS3]UDM18905.1 hypothetical protein LCH97_17835 [Vogesella sp. XCS3]